MRHRVHQPRVAPGVPVPAAGVPHGAAEYTEYTERSLAAGFAAGADAVTVTCTPLHERGLYA